MIDLQVCFQTSTITIPAGARIVGEAWLAFLSDFVDDVSWVVFIPEIGRLLVAASDCFNDQNNLRLWSELARKTRVVLWKLRTLCSRLGDPVQTFILSIQRKF